MSQPLLPIGRKTPISMSSAPVVTRGGRAKIRPTGRQWRRSAASVDEGLVEWTLTEGESMLGFRILKRRRAVSADLVSQFRQLPVANVSDVMSRMTAGGARLRPMHAGGVMAGPAVTVRTRPGDNLMVHKAIDYAEPGDVIVVDAGGDLTNAIVGE